MMPATHAEYTLLTPTARAPERGEALAAGLDIFADLLDAEGNPRNLMVGRKKTAPVLQDDDGGFFFRLEPLRRVIIPSGISLVTSADIYSRVAPRSGLSINDGLAILGGVVDCTYTGEIGAILHNTDPDEPIIISQGMKIAQLVLTHVYLGDPRQVEAHQESQRGAAGFGSTGRF